MSEERCDATELPVDQCACPQHRDSVIDCEIYGDRTSAEKKLTITGRFKVRWGADCSDCGSTIDIGEVGAYTNKGIVVCGPCSDKIEGL